MRSRETGGELPAAGQSVVNAKMEDMVIRRCEDRDFETVWEIINDGARAYQGIIPEDRWREPYMPESELHQEIGDGVVFWGFEENGELIGVMGIQQVQDVTLIRHAYVRTNHQKKGIGAQLLFHLRSLTRGPVLIGTWADAAWAIRFYEKHGFRVVRPEQKDRLLKRYWTIPERQAETSIVLVDTKWRALNQE
jgi:GNAT superfamily N-acetyltransferase